MNNRLSLHGYMAYWRETLHGHRQPQSRQFSALKQFGLDGLDGELLFCMSEAQAMIHRDLLNGHRLSRPG
jgi:hypothetical protein